MKAITGLILLCTLGLSNAQATESIDMDLTLVRVDTESPRKFGENFNAKKIVKMKATIDKEVSGSKATYFLNIPALGMKYPIAVKESSRSFQDASLLGGKQTPELGMNIKGHHLKRMMAGIGSYLHNVKKNDELEVINNACFGIAKTGCKKQDESTVYSSCWIDTQPSTSISSYSAKWDYKFEFAKQQGMFANHSRRNSFNFMRNRISFNVNIDGKNYRYDVYLNLDKAKF